MKPLIAANKHTHHGAFDTAVLLSGGLDSAVLLNHLSENPSRRIIALHFQTATRSRESRAARLIASQAGVPLQVIDIRPFLNACRTQGIGGRLTFGTTALLAMAITFVIEQAITTLALGVHQDDVYSNWEITPEYLRLLGICINESHADCSLLLPFQTWEKPEIIKEGSRLGVKLEDTWSCNLQLSERQDGICQSCCERREAFMKAEIVDPTDYLDL